MLRNRLMAVAYAQLSKLANMDANAPALLETRQLAKRYRRRTVLDGVSLVVKAGETVGLLGPNGAGKTTSFCILAGMTKPTAGTVWFDGQDITSLPIDARARLGIGLLPQERSVFSMLSVLDNIKAVLEIRGTPASDITAKAHDLLQEMGVDHLANQRANQLSGGELRRVEIARALVTRPRLLLLDEPFAAIDPITVADLQAVLHKLVATGISLVISDHNVRETLATCDRGYILHDGRVLCGGTPAELTANELVRTHYLGTNFTL